MKKKISSLSDKLREVEERMKDDDVTFLQVGMKTTSHTHTFRRFIKEVTNLAVSVCIPTEL